MFDIAFAYGITATALLLAVGHWFPWLHRLHRLCAYAYGVTAILAGASIWLGYYGRWTEFAGVVLIALAGGLATGLCYLIDWLYNLIQRNQVRHDSHDC